MTVSAALYSTALYLFRAEHDERVGSTHRVETQVEGSKPIQDHYRQEFMGLVLLFDTVYNLPDFRPSCRIAIERSKLLNLPPSTGTGKLSPNSSIWRQYNYFPTNVSRKMF